MEKLAGSRANSTTPALSKSTVGQLLNRKEDDDRLPNKEIVANFVRACMLCRDGNTAQELLTHEVEQWVSVRGTLVDAGKARLEDEPPPQESGNPLARWIRQHKGLAWASAGLLALFIVAGVFVAGLMFSGRGAEKAGSSTSMPADNRAASSNASVPACDSYEVRAQDLWLRDEYGGPMKDPAHGQLRQGQRVTVQREANGLGQIEVKADDGRVGRVDPRYLEPKC
ncbi:hypothetical protein [Nonomuraea sp. NEAU-A123]|uniref:hypothetical protein n=1 Tax=Nonomuraea sp. NEAU-A123 TaxID=2839649 RepID=UPI00203225C6|nr:hypothetical protein [Nonomuraea sp. NEAU-A123]